MLFVRAQSKHMNTSATSHLNLEHVFPVTMSTCSAPSYNPQTTDQKPCTKTILRNSLMQERIATVDADADADTNAAAVTTAEEALSWLRSLPPRDWDYEWQLSVRGSSRTLQDLKSPFVIGLS